ncbi:expressed unknown protein [Seminavis robusta]|uniref:Uncharacterized protein n=1 Tax=Seminavis robusta TaxID=568900 RepID=A0A9N8EYE6_9STRA|nr:expressed unknown protein [Seminavis robusta]|eukprot:Sro1975_g308790.1 n/a (423) ;mRNA; f:7246-8514
MSASSQPSSDSDNSLKSSAPPISAFPPQMKKQEDPFQDPLQDPLQDPFLAMDVSAKTDITHTEEEEEEAIIVEEVQGEKPETEIPQVEEHSERFERGDHVYQWCSVLGIPRAFQHHGIVIHAEDIPSIEGDAEVEQLLTIADFSNLLFTDQRGGSRTNHEDSAVTTTSSSMAQSDCLEEEEEWHSVTEAEEELSRAATRRQASGSSGSLPIILKSGSGNLHSKNGVLRVYTTISTKEHKWHKVKYSANWFHAHLWKRSGTCTPAPCDPPEAVMHRVNFLLNQSSLLDRDDQSVLPKYHSIYANCECLAVWAKTGNWSTLQASSMLSHAAVGQVKTTTTLASIAAAQTVTVPAAGMWGWMGFSTSVPLMTANPLILPALVTYGTVSVGLPAVYLAMAKSRWNKTTETLNEALAAESREVSLVT